VAAVTAPTPSPEAIDAARDILFGEGSGAPGMWQAMDAALAAAYAVDMPTERILAAMMPLIERGATYGARGRSSMPVHLHEIEAVLGAAGITPEYAAARNPEEPR
jgi:hypothetical protein